MHRELVAMLALAGTVAAGCAHSDAETTGEPAPGTTTSAVPWRLVAPTPSDMPEILRNVPRSTGLVM